MELPIDDSIGEEFQSHQQKQQQPPSPHHQHQQQYFTPPQLMMEEPPPHQQVFYAPRDESASNSPFPKLDKSMYLIIFVAFLLGFFMGKTQPIVLRTS